MQSTPQTIAFLGAGPAALFLLKRFVENHRTDYHILIFEQGAETGKGMPYSREGANAEHITNISDHELPPLVTSMEEWLKKAPEHLLQQFKINEQNFNEFKVVPRLLFGEYLAAQFTLMLRLAKEKGIRVTLYRNTKVTDLIDDPEVQQVRVIAGADEYRVHRAVICTGHDWPKKYEGKIKGYFDSPYPPSKLEQRINYPVAIRGSSLTAFDAVRTLSRNNGQFITNASGKIEYIPDPESDGFCMVLHSINGLLPAIRIHMEDATLSRDALLSKEELQANRNENMGFVSLDFLFEKKFKDSLRKKDPDFYERIKAFTLEEFVAEMMSLRKNLDPFTLFRAEYREAEKSIKRMEPVYWKELLAELSYTVNYPAKYFSAEDMIRMRKVLMPLISIVIAFVPQASAAELLALHDAGVLSVIAVDAASRVEPGEEEGITYHYTNDDGEPQQKEYRMFIDCIGQPPLAIEDIPLKSLVDNYTVTPARLPFRSPEAALQMAEAGNNNLEQDRFGLWYLKLPGIMVNDNFQLVDSYGAFNDRIYVMAVPYIAGINPDYSGLDFCEAASEKIIRALPLAENEVDSEIK